MKRQLLFLTVLITALFLLITFDFDWDERITRVLAAVTLILAGFINMTYGDFLKKFIYRATVNQKGHTVDSYLKLLLKPKSKLEKKFLATIASNYFYSDHYSNLTEEYFNNKKGENDPVLLILQNNNWGRANKDFKNTLLESLPYKLDMVKSLEIWYKWYGNQCLPVIGNTLYIVLKEKNPNETLWAEYILTYIVGLKFEIPEVKARILEVISAKINEDKKKAKQLV